jgi:type IV pilus assembly protein PilN
VWLGDAEVPAVILINLLPHREEKRKRRKVAFFVGLALAAGAGLAVVGMWFAVLEKMIDGQQNRNNVLSAEITKLETKIKDIATLKAEIESLKARQKAVEDLQTDRNIPVHVLNELVKQTPEGVYLTVVKQDGPVLTLAGLAQTNERVSELLRNTSTNSVWLTRPELVEIKVGSVQAANKDQKRLFDFSMRVSIKPPQEAQAAASAPVVGTLAAPPSQAASAVAPKKPK